MKILALIIAAYLTLVCETVLMPALTIQPPAACWVWLVLPWIAVTMPDGRGISTAAFFGLCVDCLAEGILGPGLCLAVIGTSVMQRCVTEDSMRTAFSVSIWTLSSCFVLSSALCSIQLIAGLVELSPQQVVFQVSSCSAIAAAVVVALSSFGRLFLPKDVANMA
jgi:rod shape-determining protein MreD